MNGMKVSSDDNETVEVKVLMSLPEENDVVSKKGARNGEWVKIYIRKRILGVDELTEDLSSSRQKDIVFVKSSADDTKVSIPGVERPWLSEAECFIFLNHDTGRILPAESQRSTTDPLIAISDSLATDYDSMDETSICSTPLPPLKKLDGVEPISRPKTIKSILRSKSTFKSKTFKGVIINEPSSARAKDNKSSSASKVNSASADGLKYNLISIIQLGDAKYIVQFDEKRGTIFNSNKKVVMIAQRVRDVYVLDMTSSAQESCFFTKASENLNWLWYKRLAHLNFKTINKLEKQNLAIGLPLLVYSKDKPCSSCEKGKHHRASFKTKPTSSIKKSLHLLYMDLFRPITPRSINHEKYTIVIVDEYSRYTGCPVYIHNHKDHLGKFDEKANDGYLLGYSLVSKAFRDMDEETKNYSFTHILAGSNLSVLVDKTKSAGDGLKTAHTNSSTNEESRADDILKKIKLEDLSKFLKDTRSTLFTLESPQDDLIIVTDKSKEEEAVKEDTYDTSYDMPKDTSILPPLSPKSAQMQELMAQVQLLKSQKDDLEQQKATTKVSSLKAKPLYLDVNQLTTLLVTSLKYELSKLLASHNFASYLPTELKELPSKFTELSKD
nr:retrovirus-related Pol polyprotein from transposon TNT 1-94 [Tanacetum cinerariifolium]